MRQISIIILGAFYYLSALGQPKNIKIKDTLPLSFLLNHPSIQMVDLNDILVTHELFPNYGANLIFINSTSGVFALANGMGAVYRLNPQKVFERIDSTLFHGYNNNAINFIYHDTLFSYGGYGLWHNNGQLRYFNSKKSEWELKLLDRLLPVKSEDFTDLRLNDGVVYVNPKNNKLEGVKNNNIKNFDTVFKLNINTGEIESVGLIENSLNEIQKTPITLYTNYGTLLIDNYKATLLDFKSNQIRSWVDIHLGDIYLSGLGKFKTIFNKDSTIYFFNENNIDSIVIPLSNMNLIGKAYIPFITKQNQFFNSLLLDSKIISIFVSVIITIVIIIIKKISKKKSIIEVNSNEIIEKEKSNIQFSFIEIEILELLLKHIHLNEKVKVDDLNIILGVTKKSIEVQRKQRSQSIASINIKAKEILNISEDLIVRVKNEADSRMVLYSINKSFEEKVKEIISSSKK